MTLWGGSPVLPSWKNKEFFKVKKQGSGTSQFRFP